MRAISYRTIQKNMRLTDFNELHDYVVFNSLRNIPDKLKTFESEPDPEDSTLLMF